MHDIGNVWVWAGFAVFLVIALSVDTFIMGKENLSPHKSMRIALAWSLFWIACALVFNVILYFYLYVVDNSYIAKEVSIDFFTGYLIEKSLSVDNLFAFYLIFNQFKIPVQYQHRVFSYGIWSAIFMRLGLILVGTWLIVNFHWLLYVMGVVLLLTGIKMIIVAARHTKEEDLHDSWTYKVLARFLRVTTEFQGHNFFLRKNQLLYATPLFAALIFVEISDVIFALDSIPAIFAITTDPFIVWSSNIFAILGLRAMYFLLAGMIHRFSLLKYGIALILVFVGAKMIASIWIAIPVEISLAVIAGLLTLFCLLSVWYSKPIRK